MGYYTNQQPPSQPPNKKSGWTMPIVIALIVAVLLILVIYPNLAGKNVAIEDPVDKSKDANDASDKTEEIIQKETVQLDVSTQITDIVETVSPSAVGVTNIQMRSNSWQQGEGNESATGSGVIY